MPDQQLTVGQLTHHHLSRTVTVPGLHEPFSDYDAPPTDVTGILRGFEWTYRCRQARCALFLDSGPVGGTLPTHWPVTIHPRAGEAA